MKEVCLGCTESHHKSNYDAKKHKGTLTFQPRREGYFLLKVPLCSFLK